MQTFPRPIWRLTEWNLSSVYQWAESSQSLFWRWARCTSASAVYQCAECSLSWSDFRQGELSVLWVRYLPCSQPDVRQGEPSSVYKCAEFSSSWPDVRQGGTLVLYARVQKFPCPDIWQGGTSVLCTSVRNLYVVILTLDLTSVYKCAQPLCRYPDIGPHFCVQVCATSMSLSWRWTSFLCTSVRNLHVDILMLDKFCVQVCVTSMSLSWRWTVYKCAQPPCRYPDAGQSGT